MCPLGAHSESSRSENITCPVLAHLHCANCGQYSHCCDCCGQPNSGCCSYVLLSRLVIIYGWCLFYNSYHKYDYRQSVRRK